MLKTVQQKASNREMVRMVEKGMDPETDIENRTLFSYCGLFCGNCKRGYARNSDVSKLCKNGCGFASCSIRKCAQEKNLESCAECDDYLSCKLLNSFMSKLFGFIFRSNRIGTLNLIRNSGYDHAADLLKKSGKMTVPKK